MTGNARKPPFDAAESLAVGVDRGKGAGSPEKSILGEMAASVTPYILEMKLPGLPRMTNPSGRGMHWAVRAAEARKWKDAIVKLVGYSHKPKAPLERARLILTRCSAVAPDPDGLVSGFKHVIDGLVLAGIIKNDRVSNIGMPDYRWERAPRGGGCIRVRVVEILGGEDAG